MNEVDEKRNRRLGFISSVTIHGVLILLFVFAMGWKAPNPPLSEMGSGIELNFGLDDQGSGDVQPDEPVGATNEVKVDKQAETDQPKQEEQVKEEAAKPVEPTTEKPLTSQEESPVTVAEPKKEVKVSKPADKPVVEKPAEEKTKNTATSKSEEKKSSKEPEPKKTSEEKKGAPGNQGDDKGKTGDKGNPQGTLDAKALYGKPGKGGDGDGGGGGGGISIEGFAGFEKPSIAKPEIPNESYGTYTFKVTVSKDGEVISIRSTSKGISLEAERIFKQTIETTEFIAKISNSTGSEGTITFKVIAPPAKKD